MDPKRIAVCSTVVATGGLGSYLLTMVEGLKRRGWDIHLLTTHSRGNLCNLVNKSVKCYDLSPIPLSKRKVFVAADLLNEIKPNILLVNHASLIHYALPLLRIDIKPVVVLHSDDSRFYRTATFLEERIFRWIAPTTGLASNCKTYLRPELRNRVRIIPHGVTESIFNGTIRISRESDRRISFVGFLGETKGVHMLPDIMHRVWSSYPNARLNIIGEGPLRSKLEEYFRTARLQERCEFIGSVPREAVATYLRQSDIYLLPTNLEGFGLAIVEAMMSGAVPVVSRLPGIVDQIIDDEKNGILIEPGHILGFADAIIRLLSDPGKLRTMSEAARHKAIKSFSSEHMIDSYEALFLECDDRRFTSNKGAIGWMIEVSKEILRKGIDRDWVINRVSELAKN